MSDAQRDQTPDSQPGNTSQDAQWQKQQIRSFTAWVNTHLLKAGSKVESIGVDFSEDPLKLIKLVEIISNDKLPKPEKGKFKIAKIQNLNLALQGIESKGVKLAGISSEEIYDKNLKMILGMVWILILRFQIQDISVEEMSARDGLLLWCKKKTAGYKNCNVQNFHTSFQDGHAFCALIHKHRPDLLDYNSLTDNKRDNLNLAFKVAEEHLQIPRMLDADEILESSRPDERSIMTYVAAYYHAFAGSQKNELAAKRLEEVFALNQEIQKMINEYESRASDLLQWIAEKEHDMKDETNYSSIDALKEGVNVFSKYKAEEKPPKSQEKLDLENHYSSLQTKLRLNNRPAYHPEEGLLVSNIETNWNCLGDSEKHRSNFLKEEQIRLKKMERIGNRFLTKVSMHKRWAKAKSTLNTDLGKDVGAVMSLIKQHEALEADVEAQVDRVSQIKQILDDLTAQNYHRVPEFNVIFSDVTENFESIKSRCEARKNDLESSLAHQKKLDDMRLEFAKESAKFVQWTENITEDLMEDTSVETMEEIGDLTSNLNDLKNQIANHKPAYDAVMALAEGLKAAGVTDNNYTVQNVDTITELWGEIQELVNTRLGKIGDETSKQEDRESLRVRFAEPANALHAKMTDLIHEINTTSSQPLEEQLKNMNSLSERVENIKPEVSSVADLDKLVQEAYIFNNPHAKLGMPELAAMYERMVVSVNKNLHSLENQIMIRDQSGISEQQINELKEAFNHFDKNNTGFLDKNEFRSALLASGVDLPSEEATASSTNMLSSQFDEMYAIVDPGLTGKVSLEAFIGFMSRDKTDSSSVNQFLDSFRSIAGDKDYITKAEVIQNLTPAMAEYTLSLLKPYPGVDDGLDYKALSAQIFSQ